MNITKQSLPKSSHTKDQVYQKKSYKIKPHKRYFITFQSWYDYRNDFKVAPHMVKNPKWCHLNLKSGHTGEYRDYAGLGKIKSLRLLSLHLESYSLDSQACGDRINPYFGELDKFTRAGCTLKKLSLSVTYENSWSQKDKMDAARKRLERFVKKQKNLEEFGIYNGALGNGKKMTYLLKYVQKSIKILTIENLTMDDLFKRYMFPKLQVVRLEYILFYYRESHFNFSILVRVLKDILSLPSLQYLVFAQYQRYDISYYYSKHYNRNNYDNSNKEYDNDLEEDMVPKERFDMLKEFPIEFWRILREELCQNSRPLKIRYHKQDEFEENAKDTKIWKNIEEFKKLFCVLAPNQTFEYQVRTLPSLSNGTGLRLTMPRATFSVIKMN